MKKTIVLKIFICLLYFAILPNRVFCIDLDSLMQNKSTDEIDCLKISPSQREHKKECKDFNTTIGSILRITKEDLFDKIRDDIKTTSEPNVKDLSFAPDCFFDNGNINYNPPHYVIKNNDYYACDIFHSIFVNSYGYAGKPDIKFCHEFSKFTKLLASFYEEKLKDPNASPDRIAKKLQEWQTKWLSEEEKPDTPDKPVQYKKVVTKRYLRELEEKKIKEKQEQDARDSAKILIAFAKDYDKFLESIFPEYSQKKYQIEKNKQMLVAKQEKQKEEEQKRQKEEQKRQEAQYQKQLKQYGVQDVVNPIDIETNPFRFKGKVISCNLRYERMMSETTASFTSGNSNRAGTPDVVDQIIVSGIPRDTHFDVRWYELVLRGKGTTVGTNAFGANVSVPDFQYVGVIKRNP